MRLELEFAHDLQDARLSRRLRNTESESADGIQVAGRWTGKISPINDVATFQAHGKGARFLFAEPWQVHLLVQCAIKAEIARSDESVISLVAVYGVDSVCIRV